MATLTEYYLADFDRLMNVGEMLGFFVGKDGQDRIEAPARLHLDFDAGVTFASIYLMSGLPAKGIINALIANPDRLSQMMASVLILQQGRGDQTMNARDLRFSGRLFIYHEDLLPEPIQEQLVDSAKARGLLLHFRGPGYAAKRSEFEKPMAFISHDTRDKEDVARPVAIGLSKLMCPVWYDEFSLRIGQSLRESIERGIKECRKCILVLSPAFLSNPGWTRVEFDSIFTRQVLHRERIVLPVWHGVTVNDVYEYSPSLADVVGINTSVGIDEVIRRLHRAIVATSD